MNAQTFAKLVPGVGTKSQPVHILYDGFCEDGTLHCLGIAIGPEFIEADQGQQGPVVEPIKARRKPEPPPPPPYQVRTVEHGSYGDSGVDYLVLPGDWSKSKAWHYWTVTLGRSIEGYRCHAGDYDCCGRIGTRVAYLVKRGSRVLIRQSWYRDV